jgi:hypothetical protein
MDRRGRGSDLIAPVDVFVKRRRGNADVMVYRGATHRCVPVAENGLLK